MLQENLKKLRKKRGFESIEDFSKAIGIPPTTLRGYESPTKRAWPKEETLFKICEVLGCSFDDLLGSVPVASISTAKTVLADAGVKFADTGESIEIPFAQFFGLDELQITPGSDGSTFQADYEDVVRCVNFAQQKAKGRTKDFLPREFRASLFRALQFEVQYGHWRETLQALPKAVKDGHPVEIEPGSKFNPDYLPALPKLKAEKDGEKQ